MAIGDIRFFSKALDNTSGLTVMLPAQVSPPWGVLYLLHGLGGDYTDWRNLTDIVSQMEDKPMMIVAPDGGRSYYANNQTTPGGNAWEDHIVSSVVDFVDRTFPTRQGPAGRVIAGLSMGGYGAMMLALRHPKIFGAAMSMSGSLYFAAQPHPCGEEYPTTLMNSLPVGEYDCFKQAEKFKQAGDSLKIRFDCGVDDQLIDCNREFHAHLEELEIVHEFNEYPGEHNWTYWQQRVPEVLAFAQNHFGNEDFSDSR